MIIIMKPGASKDAVQHVKELIESKGLTAHLSEGTQVTIVGVVGVRSFYGRCHTATGNIDLARMLIHAPEECVRAICCHELAHLVYKSHGTRFKALVRRICPQADEATALLECRGCAPWEVR